jgi:enamine deaminase RidA (YjgF/YER057c/UK114 family)
MTGGGGVRSASFAGVRHAVLLAEGGPDEVAGEVARALDGAGLAPVHVSVHGADPAIRDAAVAALGARGVICATDALVQPPAGAECAAVLWAVDGAATVSHPAPGATRLDFAGGTLVRLGHVAPPAAADFAGPFGELQERLGALGLGLLQLWKTWSYLPVPSGREDGGAEFVAFNLHRAGVFGDATFPLEPPEPGAPAYPANTGVADLSGAASLTGMAGTVGDGVRVLGVENARQHPPSRYGAGTGRPRPAQFSRAVVLEHDGRGLVLMAGTAAVVDSHTVGADAAGQLDTTLDIVDGLLSEGALAAGGATLSGGLDALLHLVVYVARAQDLDPVRRRVAQRVPVPAIVVLAPLTRADLLVEVDGLAVVAVSGG